MTRTNDLKPPINEPFVLKIELDRSSPIPLHTQISEPLEALITAGSIPSGSLIEDEVSMATRLKVSRPTARRALQDLVGRGLLSRRRGAGTRVTPTHIHRPFGLTSLEEDLRNAGFETKTEVLSYEIILTGERESELLSCPVGTEAVKLKRLRSSNGEPLAILSNLLPARDAPSISELSTNGLYQCLRERGVTLATAQQAVTARSATDEQSKLLGVEVGAPLLTLRRTAYDPQGSVVEYGDHVYDAARYTLNFTSVAE